MTHTPPTPAYLRQRLRYEPETGKLFWRHYAGALKRWNTRYAGQEAFTCEEKLGYRRGSLDGQLLLAHRVIWAMVHDRWPEDEIDHRDRKPGNNRIGNLRERDHKRNRRSSGLSLNNTSGVTGVDWHKGAGKWRARIKVDGRDVHLGLFDEKHEAVTVRMEAGAQHAFDPTHGAPK